MYQNDRFFYVFPNHELDILCKEMKAHEWHDMLMANDALHVMRVEYDKITHVITYHASLTAADAHRAVSDHLFAELGAPMTRVSEETKGGEEGQNNQMRLPF